MRKLALILVLVTSFTTLAFAGTQTVTLSVPGMTCAACPIIVKKALNRVDGVTDVEISYEMREAVVTFDDTRTSIEEIIQATANAGYPSQVKQ